MKTGEVSDNDLLPASNDPCDGGFDVTVTASPHDVTVTLRGRLTAASVAVAAREILGPVKRLKPREVILDGSEVTYCDGAGIGLIGEVRQDVSVRGGTVRFIGFSADLQ